MKFSDNLPYVYHYVNEHSRWPKNEDKKNDFVQAINVSIQENVFFFFYTNSAHKKKVQYAVTLKC